MFSVEGHGRKADRKSRHLYDLSEMMKHGIDDKAIKNDDLWAHLQSSVFKLSKDLIDSIHEEGIVAYTS